MKIFLEMMILLQKKLWGVDYDVEKYGTPKY